MVALIATNGVFVAAEFGLTTVDRSKLRRLPASGDQRAGGVLAAVQELSLQLSGAQLGITLTSLLLGLVAEPVLARLLDMPLQALGLPDAVADAGAVVRALLLATVVQMPCGDRAVQRHRQRDRPRLGRRATGRAAVCADPRRARLADRRLGGGGDPEPGDRGPAAALADLR